jgi:cysteine desulfurase/selenocysteine lyase
MDIKEIRKQFPIYDNIPNLVYLDSGATALKPKCVLDKMNEYYSSYGVNIHRGVYSLSYQATDEYDKARDIVAKFINSDFKEVVFTKNVSDALNKICLMLENNLNESDEVITSELEHHSSVLPWMKACERRNATLKYIPLNHEGRITVDNFKKVLTSKTKIVALTLVSNVMGYLTPIKEIIDLAHEVGAVVIVDAAQAIQHFSIDVKQLNCDFLAFSGHKAMGPTGIGVLYGKKKLLKTLQPIDFGGDMNEEVDLFNVEIKDIPYRFETGTPPIAEAIGLGKALEFINELGLENIHKQEKELHKYAIEKLEKIEGITIYNKTSDVGIISFNIDGVHPHDAATFFDEANICLRAGHHCAQLITKWLKCVGTLRASLYIYNNYEDIDRFVEVVKQTVDFFKQF